MRQFTALKDGVVVSRGTFHDEDHLKLDYPAPEYELKLDEYHAFVPEEQNYADQRREAYPPLSEFADAMYWQTQGDSTHMEAYLAKVKEVKERFPKK